MTLAIENNTTGKATSSAATLAAAYTTSGDDRIVVLHIYNTTITAVSSIVDSNGLTWTMRTRKAASDFSNLTVETWWAYAPSAVSATATITLAGTTNGQAVHYNVYAVSGIGDVTAPFDTNANFPAFLDKDGDTGARPTVTVDTDATESLVVGFYGSRAADGALQQNTGWTALTFLSDLASPGTHESGGTHREFSSQQASLAVEINANRNHFLWLVDAFNGDAPPPAYTVGTITAVMN